MKNFVAGRRKLFSLVVAMSIIGSGYLLASSKRAALPDALLTAKTLYLVNKTGSQEVLDTAYDQFTKWARFTLVKSKDEADIVAIFTHDADLQDGTSVGFTKMTILIKGSEDPAFQVTEPFKVNLFGLSSTKSCVAELKKRLQHN